MKSILLNWYRLVLGFFQWMFFRKIAPTKLPIILIVWRDAHLGDGLLSIPTLIRIRKNFPNAHIILLSHNNGLPGIHFKDYLANGLVNEIWDRSTWSIQQTIAKIKNSRAQALLALFPYSASLKWNLFSMFVVRFSGIRMAQGWKKESTFLGKKYLMNSNFTSELDRLEQLLNDFYFEKIDSFSLEEAIRNTHLSIPIPSKPFLIFAPFTKGTANVWPISNWIQLGKEIQKETELPIYIVGGENDQVKAEKILSNGVIGEFIAVPIPELLQWIKNSRGIIGADSGAIHLANLLKKKNIVLFGNSDYRGKWAHPENPNQKIIYPQVRCTKCLGRREHECSCMNHLPLDAVLSAMDSYF